MFFNAWAKKVEFVTIWIMGFILTHYFGTRKDRTFFIQAGFSRRYVCHVQHRVITIKYRLKHDIETKCLGNLSNTEKKKLHHTLLF